MFLGMFQATSFGNTKILELFFWGSLDQYAKNNRLFTIFFKSFFRSLSIKCTTDMLYHMDEEYHKLKYRKIYSVGLSVYPMIWKC